MSTIFAKDQEVAMPGCTTVMISLPDGLSRQRKGTFLGTPGGAEPPFTPMGDGLHSFVHQDWDSIPRHAWHIPLQSSTVMGNLRDTRVALTTAGKASGTPLSWQCDSCPAAVPDTLFTDGKAQLPQSPKVVHGCP